MATKEEIQEYVTGRLIEVRIAELGSDGSYVKAAVDGNISDQEYDSIAGWLSVRDFEKIGRFIGAKVRNKIATDAGTEATQILADDQFSLTEFSRVLQI